MDPNNPVIKLCIEGTQAEFKGKKEHACERYHQAWEVATNAYEACIAAHYLARCQDSPMDVLHWNQEALEQANLVKDDSVMDFYPSLYLNMGHSYELLGDQTQAAKYYAQAAELGAIHQIK